MAPPKRPPAALDDASVEGLDPSVLELVNNSPLLCLVVGLPSQQIVAVSPGVPDVLGYPVEEIIGRVLEDFLIDEQPGALDLLLAGKLIGYEVVRTVMHRGEEVAFRGWVQALPGPVPPRFVLVIAWERGAVRTGSPPRVESELPSVIGTVDRNLVIDRISAEVRRLLGYGPEALIGTPLLSLVVEPDVANILLALGQAASTGRGVTHRARVHGADGRLVLCSVLLLPLVPVPSAAFALLPAGDGSGGDAFSAPAVQTIIERLAQTLAGATLAQEVAHEPWSASSRLSQLSTRELDVVRRLAAGDRVPTIAASLYVSQSTVRNHLSTVFKKLGVHSQQELVVLLREMGDSSPGG